MPEDTSSTAFKLAAFSAFFVDDLEIGEVRTHRRDGLRYLIRIPDQIGLRDAFFSGCLDGRKDIHILRTGDADGHRTDFAGIAQQLR